MYSCIDSICSCRYINYCQTVGSKGIEGSIIDGQLSKCQIFVLQTAILSVDKEPSILRLQEVTKFSYHSHVHPPKGLV